MTHQYSIEQVQTQLIEIISEVEQGKIIHILKSGQCVAVLMPMQDYESLTASRPSFWEAIETFRRDFKIDEEGVDNDFWEGLRDQSPGREVDL